MQIQNEGRADSKCGTRARTDWLLARFFQVSNTNNKLHTQVGPDPTSANTSLTIKGGALLLANTKAKCLRCSHPFLLTLSFEMTQNWSLPAQCCNQSNPEPCSDLFRAKAPSRQLRSTLWHQHILSVPLPHIWQQTPRPWLHKHQPHHQDSLWPTGELLFSACLVHDRQFLFYTIIKIEHAKHSRTSLTLHEYWAFPHI